MAIRTTSSYIESIVEKDTDIIVSSSDWDSFIATGSILVDRMVSDAKGADGAAYYVEATDSVQLELIERWLSAHFYAVRDPRFTSESAGGVSTNFLTAVDLNLNVTMYGQQAMILDTSGYLADIQDQTKTGKKQRVGVFWSGTDPANITSREGE